jgi:two-component system, NarL family, response regulator LiaR
LDKNRVKTQIKVLIVDDYAVVRQGLQALIDTAPDMVVVGEAADGITAVQHAHDLQPDVVVMDLVMPGLDGISAIEAIQQKSPLTRVLILTNFSEEQRVRAAFRAGAQGYMLKDAILTDVVEAIRDVHAGKLSLHPSITHVLMQAMKDL